MRSGNKYIRNLKMQKNFEERNRDGEITINSMSDKAETKNEMLNRYSAFLSKKWFLNADPFLKAKYKDYFKSSEVKWGPNMIFKKLAKETQKVNKIKGEMEQRLNKETTYINNRIKVDNIRSPSSKKISSGKITSEKNYNGYSNIGDEVSIALDIAKCNKLPQKSPKSSKVKPNIKIEDNFSSHIEQEMGVKKLENGVRSPCRDKKSAKKKLHHKLNLKLKSISS